MNIDNYKSIIAEVDKAIDLFAFCEECIHHGYFPIRAEFREECDGKINGYAVELNRRALNSQAVVRSLCRMFGVEARCTEIGVVCPFKYIVDKKGNVRAL